MPSVTSWLAPLLVALCAAAPAIARAEGGQPAEPPAGGKPARPWVDEAEPARPAPGDAAPAPAADGATTGASGDEGARAPAVAGGRARPRAPGRGPARASGRQGDAIGYTPGEDELAGPLAWRLEAARRARFGHKGQVTVSELLGIRTGGISGIYGAGGFGYVGGLLSVNTSTSTAMGAYDMRSTDVRFRPSIDVFVADGFSMGGSLSVTYSRFRQEQASVETSEGISAEQSIYEVGVEPRVGKVIRLGDSLSIWPRVGGGYAAAWLGPGAPRRDSFSAYADVGLIAQLGRHAYFDVGPEFRLSHSRLDRAWAPGAHSTFAGLGVKASIGLAF